MSIYLDNAATSFPKAPEVEDAMREHLARIANPGRAGYRQAADVEQMIDRTRAQIAQLINADDPRRIIFTLNGTDALNMAIHGVINAHRAKNRAKDPEKKTDAQPHVVTTVLEHNSINRPLVQLGDAGAITLSHVGCGAEAIVDPADVVEALNERTVLLAMTHISNALGTIQPVEKIIALVRERRPDVVVLIDAAQSVGMMTLDVMQMDADLIAFPGHKGLLGPTGTGVLYVGRRAFEECDGTGEMRISTFRSGGTGGDSTNPVQPAELPFYLEGGTPNTIGIAGLAEGARFVRERGIDAIGTHERELIERLIDGLDSIHGITIIGTRDVSRRGSAVSFTMEGMDPMDAGMILDQSFSIAVRPGLHCAPYAHRALGTFDRGGTVRASTGPFNTVDDIDALVSAVGELTSA